MIKSMNTPYHKLSNQRMLRFMPRTKIIEQKQYPFQSQLTVRVSDLNYGAHLGYDRLLTLVQQSRMEMFAQWGMSETDLGDGKTGIVAADAVLNYRGEAFFNDRLIVEICPIEVGLVSFRLAHRVSKIDGSPIALIEIGFAAFDYKKRSATKLPDVFSEKLKSLASAQ